MLVFGLNYGSEALNAHVRFLGAQTFRGAVELQGETVMVSD